MSVPSRIVFGSLSLLLASVATQNASAQQAWVGEPSSLSVSLDYSYSRSNEILGAEEEPYNPSIFSQTAALGIEYTPIEKLGLTATVPVVCPRLDDGNTHCAL